MKHIRTPVASIALVLALAGTAPATSLADGGTMDFSYAQFPSGPYAGTYHADGTLLDGFGPEGGTAAFFFDAAGRHFVVVLSAVVDGGGSIDACAVLVSSETAIGPGVYPVDAVEGTVMFAFIDNTVSFAVPSDPSAVDWQAWFDELVASRKLVGATGAITLTDVGPHRATGTYSGISIEYSDQTMVGISGCAFAVTGGPSPVEPSTWAGVKADYRD